MHVYLGARGGGRDVSLISVVYRVTLFWLIYAALLHYVFKFSMAYPLNLSTWKSPLIHVVAAIGFGYVHLFIYSMTFAFTPSRVNAEVTLGTRVFRQVRTNFSSDFLTYWTFLLAVSAARYHRDLRDQELLAAQTQARLTEARLDALKAQLNPHFFFNTLNAISALALRGDHAAVVDTLTRLGNLVRISLDSKRPHQIALEQEMEFLDGYLEIVRLSIGERLTVEYHVTPEARRALVPSMILQPIVENAIRHGIAARPGAGRITVAAFRETDALRISVVDDGPGFRRTATPGIGLRNTEARLSELYGPKHQLVYDCSHDGGASVTITLPYHPRLAGAPVDASFVS